MKLNETSWYGLFYDQELKDKNNIRHIDMISRDQNKCKIYSDGNSVYSNAVFYPGDIIEVCPTRDINKTSLFSRDVRDIVFEVIPNEHYVIPFGYCQYYDILQNNIDYPNCDYLWDPVAKTIIIKALRKIFRDEKLVLNIKK